MKYMLFVCSDGATTPEAGAFLERECPRWGEEMSARGVRLLGRQLEPPESAATVRVREGKTVVSDGPFAETKEFIAGLDVLDCADLDEAIEIAAKHPVASIRSIEIRPFMDGLDLGDAAGAFARGDDSRGTAYGMFMCLDGIPGAPEVEDAIMRDGEAWRQKLEASGQQVFGHALRHKDTATTVRVRDGKTLVTDGPFAETHEFVGGVDIAWCADREEAIAIAAAHPLAAHHMVEVRAFSAE